MKDHAYNLGVVATVLVLAFFLWTPKPQLPETDDGPITVEFSTGAEALAFKKGVEYAYEQSFKVSATIVATTPHVVFIEEDSDDY